MRRLATCRCGQLRAICEGEPVRVSVCHCLACQQRTGSAFAVQARFKNEQVSLDGDFKHWERRGDAGSLASYRFCATCGSTVAYVNGDEPGFVAIPVGAFADPSFPAPTRSVYEERRHAWVEILGEAVEHIH